MAQLNYLDLNPSPLRSDLGAVAARMFALMLRNMASEGIVFVDPLEPDRCSRPGCILASPSYPEPGRPGEQSYVFNWTRDAALVAIELAAPGAPIFAAEVRQRLADYVAFARVCQRTAPRIDRACYEIDGQPRDWSNQIDGPALQTIAILNALDRLDPRAARMALEVIDANVTWLLSHYKDETTNLWEEEEGGSFFARSVQLRCLKELRESTRVGAVPEEINETISELGALLRTHWNNESGYYLTLCPRPGPKPAHEPYDPNIDIVMASVYGDVPCTDPKLLATAAKIRDQWANPDSDSYYPVNGADAALEFGPLLGRYPGDRYGGDVDDKTQLGHPWVLCTANFAELYHELANAIANGAPVPADALARPFLEQVGIHAAATADEAITALRAAGDRMLRAIVYHSDGLELSEQLDKTIGFQRSVGNLTWSYAAFLSAVRARAA